MWELLPGRMVRFLRKDHGPPPATMALLIDRVRPEQRGLATSTYFTGFDAGVSIGSLLLGMVSQHWGFGVMWTLAAACTLLGLAGLMADRQPSSCTV